jgi:hypothetical protein
VRSSRPDELRKDGFSPLSTAPMTTTILNEEKRTTASRRQVP